MGLKTILDSVYLAMPKYVTRTGVAADCATQHAVDMFTISGGDILVLGMYGKVMAAKDAGAQLLTLQYTPTGGAVTALCLVSLTTATDAINSIYTITGVATDAMILTQIGAGAILGIGQFQGNALGTIKSQLVLAPGIINLLTTVANDITGLINWTVLYQPLNDSSLVTVL